MNPVHRANLTGPFAEITVGADAVVFTLPKRLLCNSSTYFKAALNNGFAETATQKITLDDDDPDVFRTYAAWLFQLEITNESLLQVEDLERHLFYVYIYADKRGIRCLANDVVTMLSSFWYNHDMDMNAVEECLPLLPPQCTLYELTMDNLVLQSRYNSWGSCDWELLYSQSSEILIELIQKERAFPDSFQNCYHCFESICHYHKHDDKHERDECVEKIEKGCNVLNRHEGPWDQVEWRW
jgi:hypothetical protein